MLVFDLDIPKPNRKYCEMEYPISIQVPDKSNSRLYTRQQFPLLFFFFDSFFVRNKVNNSVNLVKGNLYDYSFKNSNNFKVQ